ncbi:MAG: hypothetical protein WD512_03455 [Candidatus Paceibacterota bacterium]
MNKNQKFAGFLLTSFFTIAIVISTTKGIRKENSIKENNFKTIAKVTKFNSNRSFNHYDYIYFFRKNKFSSYEDLNGFKRERNIGKYFVVEISTKHPEYSKINLDQEITDSLEIVKAGFIFE